MALPTADHTFECSMCSQPSPGITCERCMRSELGKPLILLTYSRAELEELADSALDAMRFWLSAEAALRVMAAKRAE